MTKFWEHKPFGLCHMNAPVEVVFFPLFTDENFCSEIQDLVL